MKAKHVVLTLVAAVLIVAATAAAVNMRAGKWTTKDLFATGSAVGAQAEVPLAPPPAAPLPLAAGASPNYRAIVQQGAPAVVGITVAGQHALGADEMPPDLNDPFFQFFRGLPGFQFHDPRLAPGGKVPFRSQGSGFIIASDGLILTNAHVVREAKGRSWSSSTTGANSAPGCWGRTRPPTSPCCASTPGTCRWCAWAIRSNCRWGTRCWP